MQTSSIHITFGLRGWEANQPKDYVFDTRGGNM